MSDAFWPYAPSNCTETLNDLPNCTNKDSTLPLFITGLPECHIDDLHSFACEVWYQVTQLISKLPPCAHERVFVSYIRYNKGIYLYEKSTLCLIKSTKKFFFDLSFTGLHNSSATPLTETIARPDPLISGPKQSQVEPDIIVQP